MNHPDPRHGGRPLSRRSFFPSVFHAAAAGSLLLTCGAGASAQTEAAPNGDHGRIKPPVPVPDIPLLRFDGAMTTLPGLTRGYATAVQMMFTSCGTVCPMQAAIFSRVQKLLPDMHAAKSQLLSLSIDPEDDNAKALSAWKRRYRGGPSWIVAAPGAKDSARIQNFFGQAKGRYADHSAQVNIVDREGRLVWRTNEFPSSEEIASLLRRL